MFVIVIWGRQVNNETHLTRIGAFGVHSLVHQMAYLNRYLWKIVSWTILGLPGENRNCSNVPHCHTGNIHFLFGRQTASKTNRHHEPPSLPLLDDSDCSGRIRTVIFTGVLNPRCNSNSDYFICIYLLVSVPNLTHNVLVFIESTNEFRES